MITADEMYVIEDNAVYNGADVSDLMETAGCKIADIIKKRFSGRKVVFFCGQGNNGGDGFVAARYLRDKCYVSVFFAGSKARLRHPARENFDKIEKDTKIDIIRNIVLLDRLIALHGDELVLVDALLGIGFSGELREPVKSAVEKFNNIKAYKIAIDTESANMAECDMIIAFTDIKEPINLIKKDGTRKILNVVNIGMPKSGYKYTGAGEVKAVLKKRKNDAKKGDSGRVLIVGGSRDYIGALALAGLAALRSGADSVIIAAPEKVAYAINSLSPDLMTRKFKCEYFSEENVKSVMGLVKNADAVLIGNGLARKSDKFVRKLVRALERQKKFYVLDADALKAADLKICKTAVLTPNPNELDILLKNSNIKRIDDKSLQKCLGENILLVKGRVDRVISRNRIKYNRTGNPGMTKAGTGDVLAGLAAGFLAQSRDRFNSACAAAFVNCLVGDKLLADRGGKLAAEAGVYSYIANDLLKDIKNVLAHIRRIYIH